MKINETLVSMSVFSIEQDADGKVMVITLSDGSKGVKIIPQEIKLEVKK